jgi:hypothetical protein
MPTNTAVPWGVQAAVYNAIQEKRNRPWANEEEVRLAWVSALESGLGVHFDAERAKKDSSYNNVIIEFKAPGLFNGSKSSPKFKEATDDRLLKYIKRAAKSQGMHEDDYVGIAIDGEHVCFAQVVGGAITTQHLLPFSQQVVGMVLDACTANYRRPVTADNLIEDFGHSSPAAIALMQGLADALATDLKSATTTKIQMLFEEWRTLYGQVADLSIEQTSAIAAALRFTWNGSDATKMAGRLFVIHTYNSLVIKLLAAEIVSAHRLTSKTSPTQEMAVLLDADSLLTALGSDIEKGDLFAEAGIRGFVEEAIFSWYLDACNSMPAKQIIVGALRDLLTKLSLYRTERLERTRDVLRDFYQDLVPETLRKSLGEFYTPDWLVEHTITKAYPDDILNIRALDPTCGSGSFLIEIIRRKRKSAVAAKLSTSDTIKLLCKTVWGFDLNPLAVQTARVNFLMEIADLLRKSPGQQIEVPVLLADAIYSPARNPKKDEDVVTYQIGSQVARLDITLPAELAFDRTRLDAVFGVMGDCVEEDREYAKAEAVMIGAKLLSPGESADWRKPLKATYDQVLKLHRQNWNGIWFRIVRNFFWSATAGKFDLVVGNPPWVRWSKLPDAYRERVKPTCEQYDIFSSTPFHGGNELDISAMITYTTADKWLKTGGKLAFVITQTVFQAASSSGFRNFNINDSSKLCPLEVDDLKALKPFHDAANKTAVVVFEKGATAPSYPVNYNLWDAAPGETRAIASNLPLSSVLSKVAITRMEATPVGGSGSPWAILLPGRWAALTTLTGASSWVEGRKGITADLNGLYFVPIVGDNGDAATPLLRIRTRPEAGRTDIGAAKNVWVEPDLLYPLIKGAADFEACYLNPSHGLYAFVPNKGITAASYNTAELAVSSLPKTKAYFKGFAQLLRNRSTFRGRMPNAPYYAVYNVGDFTFKPWKVIWAEMSGSFAAAVAGSAAVPHIGLRPYIPDHKVYFVALDDKAEAHYLCGMLNSSLVKEYVESHNIAIQVGNIFKHMHLPAYDANSAKHAALASMVELAHLAHDQKKRAAFVKRVVKAADAILERWIIAEQAKAATVNP